MIKEPRINFPKKISRVLIQNNYSFPIITPSDIYDLVRAIFIKQGRTDTALHCMEFTNSPL